MKIRNLFSIFRRKPSSLTGLPKFKNEDEERAFWTTHSMLDYYDLDKFLRFPPKTLTWPIGKETGYVRDAVEFEQIEIASGRHQAEIKRMVASSMQEMGARVAAVRPATAIRTYSDTKHLFPSQSVQTPHIRCMPVFREVDKHVFEWVPQQKFAPMISHLTVTLSRMEPMTDEDIKDFIDTDTDLLRTVSVSRAYGFALELPFFIDKNEFTDIGFSPEEVQKAVEAYPTYGTQFNIVTIS